MHRCQADCERLIARAQYAIVLYGDAVYKRIVASTHSEVLCVNLGILHQLQLMT